VVELQEFLSCPGPIFDVRAPLEYAAGHIPGATSFPLFSDDERAQVGTIYKKEGKRAAVELGVRLVGPKLSHLLEEAKSHLEGGGQCRVYCWRGGMRSGFVSWFLNFCGYEVSTLTHGYKTWRRAVLQQLNQPYTFHVVGGFTGTGKTALLGQLARSSHQVIDLEALANHRGSTFGLPPGAVQPSVEQFENDLAGELFRLDPTRPIWIEDESSKIGSIAIPKGFFERLKTSPLYFIEAPLEARVDHILAIYGAYPEDYLIRCTQKLMKKLGKLRTEEVCAHISAKELRRAIAILLDYYDENYAFALTKYQRQVIRLPRNDFLHQWGC
jgi:tRNA 2-selenouridine synthase